MRATTKAAFAAALLLVTSAACAQLRTHAKADEENISVKVEDVIPNFVAATQPLIAAQANVLTALGMAEQAAKLKAAGAELTTGATRGTIEGVMEQQGDAAEAIEDKLDDKPQLDAANTELFATGMRELAAGTAQYAAMSKELEPLRKRWRGGGVTTGALFVAKGLPFTVKKLGSSLKAAAGYSSASRIPLAPEVAQVVSTL